MKKAARQSRSRAVESTNRVGRARRSPATFYVGLLYLMPSPVGVSFLVVPASAGNPDWRVQASAENTVVIETHAPSPHLLAESDTPRRAGGLVSGAASKAVAQVVLASR